MTQPPPRTDEAHRCDFCQRPLSAFVRQGWLRSRARPASSLPPWS